MSDMPEKIWVWYEHGENCISKDKVYAMSKSPTHNINEYIHIDKYKELEYINSLLESRCKELIKNAGK